MKEEKQNKSTNSRGLVTTIVSIVLTIISILLTIAFIENKEYYLHRIQYKLYADQYGLCAWMIILVAFVLFCFVLLVLKKGGYRGRTYAFVFLFFLIVGVVSLDSFVSFWRSRRYYRRSQIYDVEKQSIPFEKAKVAYENKEWPECLMYLNEAKDIIGDNPYYDNNNKMVDKGIQYVSGYMDFCDYLVDSYLDNDDTVCSKQSFLCIQTLTALYPQKYYPLYNMVCDSITTAINNISLLYESACAEDLDCCKKLIRQYGWCWFEPYVLNEFFLKETGDSLLFRLQEYLSAEQVGEAKVRLRNIWGLDRLLFEKEVK